MGIHTTSSTQQSQISISSHALKAGTTAYRFVGGKGGVGKTTCAAAIALAHAAAGHRTLVISTDPAPSLGDALARRLGPSPRVIPLRRGSLHAMEIDASRALDRWLSGRRDALERIALRGTWLDDEDVSRLLRLSLPGIDEMAALFEIARLGRAGRFDVIVVDTAPTGHTLRMLAMPALLQGLARVFDHMQAKHRAMVDALRGGWTPDAEDAIIDEIDRDGRELAALLRDPAAVRMSWIALPEPMAVAETADAVAALAAQGIPVSGIIVNRVTPAPRRRCGWCDGRRAQERRAIRSLVAVAGPVPIVAIATRDDEPKGVRALAAMGAGLAAASREHDRTALRAVTWSPPALPRHDDVVAWLAGEDTRLLIFGGKGGVGKTTCAAAAAVEMARRAPRRRVLLLSTDPAHSLGDVFGAVVTDRARTISRGPANLDVRELDAAVGFRRLRERYAGAIDALFDRMAHGSAFEASHDRRVMHDFIDLAPPGIDELAAVIEVTDALEGGAGTARYDLIVMDTAPSGHALRLLEMPALVQDWAKMLMSILLKYQAVAGVGELGAVLLKLSQGLGRLRDLLTDERRTHFVAVTRAAALPRAETLRLMRRLAHMKIRVPAVIVNAIGRGTCDRCRRAATSERRELAALHRHAQHTRTARLRIVIAPAQVPAPHGIASLRRWTRTWHAEPSRRGGKPPSDGRPNRQ